MSTGFGCRAAPLLFLGYLGWLLAGCSGSPSSQTGRSEDVKLEVIDEAGFAKAIEQHRGRVILVDFWATWCLECMELFPHTVELNNRFADRGLTVISMNLDDPDDPEVQAEVRKFLAQRGAALQNFVSKYGATSESFERFAIPDGSLPHFKLYDRDGKLHQTFASGGETIDTQQIARAVEGLLGET